jgi:prepilin-type processing-associated H-X9-DG protein
MKLFSYLKPGLTKANSDELFEMAPRFFACPSDKAPHKKTLRSYAMGGNDMLPEHWPLGQDSATGVGLFWDKRTVLSLLGDAALKTPDALPALKIASVPVPADTVLLTEFIDPNNTMGSLREVAVSGLSQQQKFFKDDGACFHFGQFNYLMVDGHVESLSSLQTGAFDGSAGIWTLKKKD